MKPNCQAAAAASATTARTPARATHAFDPPEVAAAAPPLAAGDGAAATGAGRERGATTSAEKPESGAGRVRAGGSKVDGRDAGHCEAAPSLPGAMVRGAAGGAGSGRSNAAGGGVVRAVGICAVGLKLVVTGARV